MGYIINLEDLKYLEDLEEVEDLEEKMSPLDLEDVMKISEIAKKVMVSDGTVIRWCNNGYFPNAFRVGRSWRIPRIDVENYILQLTEKEQKEVK